MTPSDTKPQKLDTKKQKGKEEGKTQAIHVQGRYKLETISGQNQLKLILSIPPYNFSAKNRCL
jgi:hypothetical protein